MKYSPESAALIFTASTVIIGISIMLLSSAWKSLKEIQSVLPIEQRRIYPLLRLRDIKNNGLKHRELLKNCLWLGSLVLGINILINCVSLIGIAGLLVGIYIGFPDVAKENFNYARFTVFISPLVLLFSVFLIGGYRFREFIRMKRGQIDPASWK